MTLTGLRTVSYIPCNDALDLHGLITCLFKGEELSPYYQAYMNFWVSNKLVVYTYLPFARLFSDVALGVTALNYVFIFVALLSVAGAVKNMYGKVCFNASLIFLPALTPHILMAGPYIYPPSICLSSLILFLVTCEKRPLQILSLPLMGILFTLRPTALAPILVFIFLRLLSESKELKLLLKKALTLCLIFAVMLLVNGGIGLAAKVSGIHVYNDLTSAATIWTLELGTRPTADKDSGSCFYHPSYVPERLYGDEIADGMNKLWRLYGENDPKDEDEIVSIQNDIKRSLLSRAVDTAVSDTSNGIKSLMYKGRNLFFDLYKPYYIRVNAEEETFLGDIYSSPDYFGFLYGNVLYLLFFISSLFGILLLKDRNISRLVFSAFITVCMFLLLTEVKKTNLFDFYPVMILVICSCLFKVGERLCAFSEKKLTEKRRPLESVKLVSICIAIAGALIYSHAGRNNCFKGASAYTEIVSGTERVMHITLSESAEKKGYVILLEDGSFIDLALTEGEVTVPYSFDRAVAFRLERPDGKVVEISSQIIS